jgi:cytochrome P450
VTSTDPQHTSLPSPPLGPFQDLWNAWDEADTELRRTQLPHFSHAVVVQYEELTEHLARRDRATAENRRAAAREMIDVISVALNTLRWLDYDPEEIAQLTRERARDRMAGQTLAILEKYDRLAGLID